MLNFIVYSKIKYLVEKNPCLHYLTDHYVCQYILFKNFTQMMFLQTRT